MQAEKRATNPVGEWTVVMIFVDISDVVVISFEVSIAYDVEYTVPESVSVRLIDDAVVLSMSCSAVVTSAVDMICVKGTAVVSRIFDNVVLSSVDVECPASAFVVSSVVGARSM